MKRFFLSLITVLALLSADVFFYQGNIAHAVSLQCDQGQNNYADPQYTFSGIRIWGGVCMEYPTSTTWGAIVETRSSQWATIASLSSGIDQCGSNGSWVSEFNQQGSYASANYVTVTGVGNYLECDQLGHNYKVYSEHDILLQGTTYLTIYSHLNP
ncbi:hypothetical protein [Dictyobacter arantiisoli]|uniref:Uncharacterized protein n=1 Tax=Dictyobacter arantiisoli TaxID=2014874 RepID=A0A5A5TE73_9CHLR|nr:hypothetical protein [Dictyobacter arantiisoli]GCF09722.1 hypothetical protein KDI_32860 [Dictyobacter arantiisoli]